jgi:hypothetical protein
MAAMGKKILLLTILNAQYGVTTVSMLFTNGLFYNISFGTAPQSFWICQEGTT